MLLSEKISQINPSPTLSITAKAKKMRAEGINVIGFGAGEPDFDTPVNIKIGEHNTYLFFFLRPALFFLRFILKIDYSFSILSTPVKKLVLCPLI